MKKIDKFRGKYAFLSNFYPCFVYYEGIRYTTAEHAFQAAKTVDLDERLGFAVCPSPEEARKLGRKVKLRDDWNSIKLDVMRKIVSDKFFTNVSNIDLQQMLISTGDMYLEEGNSHNDRFWGTVKGEGENHLGKILMQVREELCKLHECNSSKNR